MKTIRLKEDSNLQLPCETTALHRLVRQSLDYRGSTIDDIQVVPHNSGTASEMAAANVDDGEYSPSGDST
jgi:hypothetical protein